MFDDLRLPYQVSVGSTLMLGAISLNQQILENAPINIALKTLNRHGLIAGATGSGKTKTMQVLAEQLSNQGVPSLVMDIKGDISGLSQPGQSNEFLTNRAKSLDITFNPKSFPVEYLSLSPADKGIIIKSSVADFGAVLFSRLLDLNDTQSGIMTIVFEFAKDQSLPLNDLLDVKSILQYFQTDAGRMAVESKYGAVAASSIGTIFRAILELESQGANQLFGLPNFEVADLIQKNTDQEGKINVVRLMSIQDKPQLFSTFMLKLLTDVYRQFPEVGDLDKPKLVIFIDEAHLIFNNATKALLHLLETMVKLIRSKGVGLIFCTQTPDDIPESILSQLGLKIQHALRAFTAKDRKAMKLIAQNFPPSTYYDTESLLTALSIGEALVTSLDGKGQPTPLVQCIIRAPESRMGTITDAEITTITNQSLLKNKYNQQITLPRVNLQTSTPATPQAQAEAPSANTGPSIITSLSKNTLVRQVVRQVIKDGFNALLNAFGIKRR